MTEIAATAVVNKRAELAASVNIGPGCVIEQNVFIDEGCELKANVIIAQGTRLGRNNRVFANCVLGEEPQVISCREPDSELLIGDSNVFRENVTINRGWPQATGQTKIGNGNYFMIGVHIGHDCEVEDNTVLGNYCQISGHCKIERNVWMSAYTGIHQFVTIGRYAFTGGLSGLTRDIPPFVKATGAYPCSIRGLNAIGLQRAGFSEQSIAALEQACRLLFKKREGKSLVKIIEELSTEQEQDENVKYLLDSLQRSSQHRFFRYLELFRS